MDRPSAVAIIMEAQILPATSSSWNFGAHQPCIEIATLAKNIQH
jgi:hypothetical protein